MIDTKQIIADVRANLAKLDACPRHEFRRKGDSGRVMFRSICAKCGGELDGIQAKYYEVGIGHGRKESVETIEALAIHNRELLEALKGVIRVADRNTVEFDAARAAVKFGEDGDHE
jgi:hypothetical protein